MLGQVLQYQWCASQTLIDEGMWQERAVLVQAETKSKAPFGSSNGRPDKSDGLDSQFAKLKKDLSLALREVSNLKNQLNQAKENIAKERAERSFKSILRMRRFVGRDPVNKLSEPRHRAR